MNDAVVHPTLNRMDIDDLILRDNQRVLTVEMLSELLRIAPSDEYYVPVVQWILLYPQRFADIVGDVAAFVLAHADLPVMELFYARSSLVRLIPLEQRVAVLSRLLVHWPPREIDWFVALLYASTPQDMVRTIVKRTIRAEVDVPATATQITFTGQAFLTNGCTPAQGAEQRSLWQLLGPHAVLDILHELAETRPWLILRGIKSNQVEPVRVQLTRFLKPYIESTNQVTASVDELYVASALSIQSKAGVSLSEVRRLPIELRQVMLTRLQEPWLELLVSVALDLGSATKADALIDQYLDWFTQGDVLSCFVTYWRTLLSLKMRSAERLRDLITKALQDQGYVVGLTELRHVEYRQVHEVVVDDIRYRANSGQRTGMIVREGSWVAFKPEDGKQIAGSSAAVRRLNFTLASTLILEPQSRTASR